MTIRTLRTLSALGILAAFLLPAVLLPTATAHWATAGNPATHAHFVAGGLSTDVGYFGQRLCERTSDGAIVWSGPDGTCPAGTVAFLPPARGLGLGTGDCEDLTIDTDNYVVLTPHDGVYPDDVVLDDGDVNDYYLSASFQTSPAHAGEIAPNIGTGSFQGPGNGLAGGLGQSNAANRIIWYNDIDSMPGTQATLSEIFGNDEFDGQTTYFPAPGTPYSTTRAERLGSTSTAIDFSDHDPETGIGIACFTYAIDNGPNGRGSDGAARGFVGAGGVPGWLDYPGDADGCQSLAPGAVGICQDTTNASPVFCGAGYDLNDAAHPNNTVSLTLTPEWPDPDGPGGVSPIGPWPIGNDNVYDTVLNATGPFGGTCPGNPSRTYPLDVSVCPEFGCIPDLSGCLFAPNLLACLVALLECLLELDLPACLEILACILSPELPGCLPELPGSDDVTFGQRTKAVAGNLTGSGGGIGSGDVRKGVKLHHLGWPAIDITVGGQLKIGYSVCNNVASTGCTNIPIEDAHSAPGIPCVGTAPSNGPPATTPGADNQGSGCYGHVGSRLQDCVYDPSNATSERRNPGALGPLEITGNTSFYGQAALWGTRIAKNDTNSVDDQACWPERLFWNPTTNTWTPASEPGSWNGGAWSGDNAPATARAVEGITAFISTTDLGLFRGLVLCNPGSVAVPGAVGPVDCNQTPGIAPQLPDPELGSWTAGWAAVFL